MMHKHDNTCLHTIHCFLCLQTRKQNFQGKQILSWQILELINQQKMYLFKTDISWQRYMLLSEGTHVHKVVYAGQSLTVAARQVQNWCILSILYANPIGASILSYWKMKRSWFICIVSSQYVLQIHLHRRSLHWNCYMLYYVLRS